MKLFLVRHGETEHNIAGLLAGVTDSNLTHHGVLQTQRLAKHLVKDRELRFTHVYASDLKRAFMTADEICKAQNEVTEPAGQVEVLKLEILREQDFGSLELVSWSSRRDPHALNASIPKIDDPGFKPKETKEAMKSRADSFIDDFVVPLIAVEDDSEEMCVAVVSHGLFLASLWRSLLGKLKSKNIHVDPSLSLTVGHRPLQHLPGWSNTGFVELQLKVVSVPPASSDGPTVDNDSTAASVLQNEKLDLQEEPKFLKLDHPTTTKSKSTPEPAGKHETRASSTPERVAPVTSLLHKTALTLLKLNCKDHLLNFKRARGGLGSLTYDQGQTKVDGFFKKSKRDPRDRDHQVTAAKDPV